MRLHFCHSGRKLASVEGNEDAWGAAWLPTSQHREKMISVLYHGLSQMM